jgi:D-alanyl-lipoteichoic acid acyltransferase DltB (MBOAT superfamily)
VGEGKLLPSFRELIAMLTTFVLTVFAWIFFRAENLSHAFNYISSIFSKSILHTPNYIGLTESKNLFYLILILLIIEWLGRRDKYAIEKILNYLNKKTRTVIYIFITIFILKYFFQSDSPPEFIYFQF